jgi:hypothetical protein
LTAEDKEPFEVTLPVCGKKLELRLLRVKDEDEVQRFVSQRAGAESDGDPSYTYRLSRFIVSIDGKKVSALEALAFVESMVGGDSLVMRQTVEKNDCGADLTLELSCVRCGESWREIMPFTTEFFRPSSSSGG